MIVLDINIQASSRIINLQCVVGIHYVKLKCIRVFMTKCIRVYNWWPLTMTLNNRRDIGGYISLELMSFQLLSSEFFLLLVGQLHTDAYVYYRGMVD